ncbi:MAG TPA: S41 family peptidase [Methylomirabilota bacterium]|nr:S41 family peptidase [Methylomirabilota bacterium]
MKPFSSSLILLSLITTLPAAEPATDAGASGFAPAFGEIYEILKDNLPAVTAQELDQAAIQGLLDAHPSRVTLIPSGIPASTPESSPSGIARVERYDNYYGYVRLATLEGSVADELRAAIREFQSGGEALNGIILDLRFAGGLDLSAAAGVADVFVSDDRPLIELKEGPFRAKPQPDDVKLPTIVLLNGSTSGAAETLAALMRDTESALLIGSRTAGEAHLFTDFPLKDGRILRVATGGIRLAGNQSMPPDGVTPDIEVEIDPDRERAWLENPFKVVSAAETNGQRRSRVNEADLVRMRREGLGIGSEPREETPATRQESVTTIGDPALARALDLLKGLSVLSEASKR